MTTPNQLAPAGAFQIGGSGFRYGQDFTEDIIRNLTKVASPTSIINAVELLRDYLLTMPLEALQVFKDLLPPAITGAWDTVEGAVDEIINSLADRPIWLQLTKFQEFLDGFTGALGQAGTGNNIQSALAAFQTWLQGLIDPATWQTFLNSVAGKPGAQLIDATTVLTNLHAFLGVDFDPANWNTATARQAFVTNVIQPFLTAVGNAAQEIRDALTGITGASELQFQEWRTALLSASSSLDASKLVGLIQSNLLSGVLAPGLIPNLDAGKITTGTIGAGLIPNLDAGKITSGILGAGLIPSLDAGKITTGTLGAGRIPEITQSMSTDLRNAIKAVASASSPASIPVSSLTNRQPNLFWDGGFDDGAFAGQTTFTQDLTVGETSPLASAKVVFNGTTQVMYSNQITADAGDSFDFAVKARWAGVTTSGAMMRINVRAWNASDVVISTTSATAVGAAGTQATWSAITLLGYTCPALTEYITVDLEGMANASAGSGWFDNAIAKKTKLLSGDLVQGVSASIKAETAQLFKDMTEKLFGTLVPPGTVPGNNDAAGALGNIWTIITDQAAAIANIQSKQDAAAGGNSFSDVFTDKPNGPLDSATYDVSYTGAGTGTIGVTGGAVGWTSQSGARVGRIYVKTTRPTSDFLILRGTLSDLPQVGGQPKITVVCRSDSSYNSYLFARAYSTGFLQFKADCGCVVNGVETLFVSGVSLTFNTSMVLNFGYQGNVRRYVVFSGSSKIIDYNEATRPGGVVSVLPSSLGTPANQRYFGLTLETTGSKNGGSLKSFSMSEGS